MSSIFNLKKVVLLSAVIVTAMGLHSCLDDDDDSYSKLLPNALVTTKTASDNTFFLQLDDSTTLLPINMNKSPYGDKEVRALVNYDEVKDPSGEYTKSIRVNWIDSILTKSMAQDMGEKNDSIYGTDPVEIIGDWVTIAEDGYLTLRFKTVWEYQSKPHFVNLLSGNNPDNPYEVEFRHNAYGDTHGRWGYGLVAFKLDELPDTEGKTVKLKLKWKSFSGEKSAEFNYCTRQSTAGGENIATVRNQINIQ